MPTSHDHHIEPRDDRGGPVPAPAPLRVALLLSTSTFEDFYGRGLGLTREAYLESYRNDWSWDWMRMLTRAGVEVTLYLATTGSPGPHVTPEGFAVRFLALGGLAAPWVHVPVLWRSPLGRYAGQAANAGALVRPLRWALQADRIDVFCVQEYWTARFDVLVRTLKCPLVVVDQGLPDHHEIKLLKSGSFARAAGAIVQTHGEVERLRRYGARAVRIPNAVDVEFFCPAPGARADVPTILCVGRLHDGQKRFADVLAALARLPAHWRLEIAGSGPDEATYRSLARELGLTSRVVFHGFVADPASLRELYRRATVFALPSAYEGLPMVLLEAMACGTPVVGSTIPAIADVVVDGRAGRLAPVGDVPALAQALEQVVEQAEPLGAAARELILASHDQRVVGARLADTLTAAAGTARPAV